MKNRILTILILLFLGFHRSTSAGEITPEAEKFLHTLHGKVRGLQTLTWTAEMHGGYYQAKGWYAAGGHIRLSQQVLHGETVSDIHISPTGLLKLNRDRGEADSAPGSYEQNLLWFLVPLIDKECLKEIADVSLEPSKKKNEQILRLGFKEIAVPRLGRAKQPKPFLLLFYELPDGKLTREERHSGYGGRPQVLTVQRYETVGGYSIPVELQPKGYGYGGRQSVVITDIKVDAAVEQSLLEPDLKDILCYHAHLDADDIN